MNGSFAANTLHDGSEVITLEGYPVKFQVMGGQLRVQDSVIVQPDIQTFNGVIHGIDKVMLPPGQ